MRRKAPIREGKWTKFPRYMRERAQRHNCQVCGDCYGVIRRLQMTREAIDHLIPRRWLEARGINPHQTNNLLSVCGSCHGQNTTIADRLFYGDAIGWLLGL